MNNGFTYFFFLSTYKAWEEEIKGLLFEAVLLLMSASKQKSEMRGVRDNNRNLSKLLQLSTQGGI